MLLKYEESKTKTGGDLYYPNFIAKPGETWDMLSGEVVARVLLYHAEVRIELPQTADIIIQDEADDTSKMAHISRLTSSISCCSLVAQIPSRGLETAP